VVGDEERRRVRLYEMLARRLADFQDDRLAVLVEARQEAAAMAPRRGALGGAFLDAGQAPDDRPDGGEREPAGGHGLANMTRLAC
jgi:hypothetical protein